MITIEDAFITGHLAEKCSVARVHHPGFVYNVNLRRDVVTFNSRRNCCCSFVPLAERDNRFSRAGGKFCGTT